MTRFNIISGTVVLPTLARIILCAAFLTMGWNKLMNTTTFTGENAQILMDLGVVDSTHRVSVTPAALRLDDPEPASSSDSGDDAAARDADEADEDQPRITLPELPEPPADVTYTDPATGELVVQAKRLHGVTLAVHSAGGPAPVTMGWIAAFTELIGGAMLLLGLFSRIWGLGLAITMGVAFYLTSMPTLLELGIFGVAADMSGGYAAFNRMYVQLALFVLAFGVLLTGPGPLSLDRLLFRPNHSREPEFDEPMP